jgi:DNA-binding HxlR family transcriptional regulator
MSTPASPRIQTECRKVQGLLSIVGDKWTILLVSVLREREQPLRYNDLKRSEKVSGISQQMLTRTLKALERDGMVSRTVHSTVPPQVEYALTALGRSLSTALQELGKWAHAHQDEIEGNRSRYDDGTKRPGVSREPTIR